jgi:hypothetical protein
MDSINRLNQAMEILRRQVAESARHLDTNQVSRNDPNRPSSVTSKPSLPDLRRRIQDRLRAIDPTDPQRERHQRRVFLESVLAWELGDNLLLDSRFEEMMASIDEAIAADPVTERSFRDLLAGLTA